MHVRTMQTPSTTNGGDNNGVQGNFLSSNFGAFENMLGGSNTNTNGDDTADNTGLGGNFLGNNIGDTFTNMLGNNIGDGTTDNTGVGGNFLGNNIGDLFNNALGGNNEASNTGANNDGLGGNFIGNNIGSNIGSNIAGQCELNMIPPPPPLFQHGDTHCGLASELRMPVYSFHFFLQSGAKRCRDLGYVLHPSARRCNTRLASGVQLLTSMLCMPVSWVQLLTPMLCITGLQTTLAMCSTTLAVTTRSAACLTASATCSKAKAQVAPGLAQRVSILRCVLLHWSCSIIYHACLQVVV